MDRNGKSQNPNQEIKDTIVEVFEQTPFTALQTDVLKFESKEDENSYFESLPKAYRGTTHAFNKEKDNIVLKGTVQDFEKSNYLRYNNDGKWYYAFITGVEYINHSTVKIHYVIDYFNTYQCDIDWDRVQSNVEQSHLKRRTANGGLNIVKVNQGFDTGVKETRGTEVFNPEVLFIVLVCKPSIELPGLNTETIRNVGMYKPFVYLIIPVDRYMTYTYPYKVGGNFNKGKVPVKNVLKALTNSFSDNANTINNVVNMYSTKDIGVDYTIQNGYIEFSNNQVDFIPFGESDGGINGISPIDATRNRIYTKECPQNIFKTATPEIARPFGVKIDPVTLESKLDTSVLVKPKDGRANTVYSSKHGRVQTVSYSDILKNYVIIRSREPVSVDDKDKFSATTTVPEFVLYYNLKNVSLSQGQEVTPNTIIGLSNPEGVGLEVRVGERGFQEFGSTDGIEILDKESNRVDLKNSSLLDPVTWYTMCEVPDDESEPIEGMDRLVQLVLEFTNTEVERRIWIEPRHLSIIIKKCKKYGVRNPLNIVEFIAVTGGWGQIDPLRVGNNQSGMLYIGEFFSPEVEYSLRQTGENVYSGDENYSSLKWVKYKRDLKYGDSIEDLLYALNQYTNCLQAESIHDFCHGLTQEAGGKIDYPVINILTQPIPKEQEYIHLENPMDLEATMNFVHSEMMNKYGNKYTVIRELYERL